MYALCVSGAVNTQGFVWKFFVCAILVYKNKSFIQTLNIHRLSLSAPALHETGRVNISER